MSKRHVLGALAAFTGVPMLAAETAPVGIVLITAAAVLLALPRLGDRGIPT